MVRIDRRRFIGSMAVAGVSGVAGCTNFPIGGSSDESQLGRVEIVNRDDANHVVEVRVERNDATVHQAAYLIPAASPDDDQIPGEVVEHSWQDSPARVRVSARLKGRQWASVRSRDHGTPSCFSVLITIDTNGDLALFTSSNPNRCGR